MKSNSFQDIPKTSTFQGKEVCMFVSICVKQYNKKEALRQFKTDVKTKQRTNIYEADVESWGEIRRL